MFILFDLGEYLKSSLSDIINFLPFVAILGEPALSVKTLIEVIWQLKAIANPN